MAKKKTVNAAGAVEKQIVYCRPQISDAIIWSLIYQLMRRYQRTLNLHLLELHPCSGLYDCLSLRPCNQDKYYQNLFDFNLGAQSLHVRLEVRFDIVDDYLRTDDPKDILDLICRTAELDPDVVQPPSNGPVLAAGVMSGLVRMNIFSRRHLKFFMGTEDTSGYGGGIRPALAKFAVTRPLVEGEKTGKAYRYFYLSDLIENHDNPLCLFDMAGKVIFRDDSEIQLLPVYDKYGHNINQLTAEIAQRARI